MQLDTYDRRLELDAPLSLERGRENSNLENRENKPCLSWLRMALLWLQLFPLRSENFEISEYSVGSGSGPIGYVVHDDDTGLVGLIHGTGEKECCSWMFELWMNIIVDLARTVAVYSTL